MKKTNSTTGEGIALTDLLTPYQQHQELFDSAIKRVLSSGRYLMGPELASFEQNLAKYLGIDHVVGVGSGTDALTIGLKALNLSQGDGVIIPANVYPTVFGVALSGVDIQLADVDPQTLNITAESIERVITDKTKAIVVVHLYGNSADLNPIIKLAKKHNLYIIEDCAQALGTTYNGKLVGTYGDISCFSFYPTKNLGAFGDGGAITTKQKHLANKIKLWRMYGESERYRSELVGMNSRLDEIQSACLKIKLEYLDLEIKNKRQLAQVYHQHLAGLPVEIVGQDDGHSYHLMVIKTSQRDQLADYLKSRHIGVGVHYPVTIHQTPSFEYLEYREGDFPVSEQASQQVLSLPMYGELSVQQVERVTKEMQTFFQKI